MKPTKNRIFCNGCKKLKILFETQKKADNFIKFNHDEILEETGKSPTRSYYCKWCGGYHVTSNTSEEIGENLDRRDQQEVSRFDEKLKETTLCKRLYSETSQLLVDTRRAIKEENKKKQKN